MDFELMEERSMGLLEKVEKDLFENRVIYLNEDISAYTVSNIVPLIHKINKDDENIKSRLLFKTDSYIVDLIFCCNDLTVLS